MNGKINNWKWIITFVILVIVLVACSEDEPTPGPEVPTEPETVIETISEITPDVYQNTAWLWVSFNDAVEGTMEIPEPDRYQIVLNDDGTIDVQADCNMVGGSYTVEGSSISIELGPSTMAACPEDSLGDQFAQYLTAAAIMFFDSGDMLFDLTADSGTMRFSQRGGGVPQVSQPSYRWGEVADKLWVLLGYGEASKPTVVEEGTVITAIFSSVEPTVGGTGGCNNYFAGYESTDSGELSIEGPIGSTMMFCEESMDAETAYFAALETVSGWSLTEEGWLELTYDSGQPYDEKMIFAPGKAPLAGPTWMLVSFGDPDNLQSVEEGTSITAKFAPEADDGGVVGGNATCNSYTTSYTVDADQISFGPIAGTLMMCPIGADQEQAYLAALESAHTYQIAGPHMQIVYDDGVLNYTSQNLPLENVLWQAVMVAGAPVPEEVEITALFYPGDEVGIGNVGGNSSCNNYSTSYETSEDISTNPTTHFLTINSPMAMTLSLCPDQELADLEMSYLAAFESAETYEILGNQLVVHSANGDIQYAANREPLMGTVWSLISLGDIDDPQPPVEGSNFTAGFYRLPTLPTGTVSGVTGCNDYNATFTADLNKIKINLPEKSNNEDCPWGVGNFEVEQQYFLALHDATEYRILGNVLQIPYGDGQALNFQATEPTFDTILDLGPLDNTFWYLHSIGGNPLISYTEITAGFEVNEDRTTGRISGSSGCNAYSADIGVNFSVSPIARTQKACPYEVMEQEGGYLDWLSKAYWYSRAGDQLLISTSNGILTYQSTPILNQSHELQNVTWYLVSVGNLTAVPGSNTTTIFAGNSQIVSGKTGCNDFSGSYFARPGNALTISGFVSTLAACPSNELTRQEEALLVFLPSAVSYLVNGNQMQIQTADGSVINYTSVPPVQPVPPTAVINGPQGIDIGQTVTFDGSGSRQGSTPIVRYEWDMGDGTFLSGPTIQYAYNTASSFNVRLRVVDQAGLAGEATQGIQVYPVVEVVPPTAAIEGPSAAFVGDPVTFSAANSQQGTAEVTRYRWHSGDGNNTGSIPESTFTTIYAKPGTYYPEVTVTDASGLSDSASMAILINATLEGTDWILDSPIAGTSISLVFRNGTLSGFAGCNSYNADYITTLAAGPTNNISIGPIAGGMALCDEPIMNQEQAYLANLQTADSYTISGNSLTLTTAGESMVFFGAMAVPLPVPAVAQ